MNYEPKIIDGLKFDTKSERYVLDRDYANNLLNIDLETIYLNGDDAYILDINSRQIHNHIYGASLTYPEDIEKKKYLVSQSTNTLKVLREAMASYLEEMLLFSKHRVLMSSGYDAPNHTIDSALREQLEKYPLSKHVTMMLEQDPKRYLHKKERLFYIHVEPELLE